MREKGPVNRPNLDMMRAIAVGTVLLDHTALMAGHPNIGGWSMPWIGVFGVYLFFVHTSLVLMWPLERRPHTLDFYTRRIFRIFPLSMLAILIVCTLGRWAFPGHISPSLFLSNFFLLHTVWPHANLLGVQWSLHLEVAMYLFLPMLFIFARKERTIWPFLLFWGFAYRMAGGYDLESTGNNFITTVPHFLPGVMAYIGFKREPARWPAVFFGLLLVVLCAFFEQNPGVRRGWWVCLTLGLLLPRFQEIQNRMVRAVSHTMAKYSYGIYLLHPFSLHIAFVTLRSFPLYQKLTVAAFTIAIFSFLAYHLVEKPAIALGSRVANRLQNAFGTSYTPEYGLELSFAHRVAKYLILSPVGDRLQQCSRIKLQTT